MKGAIFLVSLLVCLSMIEAFSVKKWGRRQAKAVRRVQKPLFAKSSVKAYSPACVNNILNVEIFYEINYAWCSHDAGTLTADLEQCHSRGLCLITQ